MFGSQALEVVLGLVFVYSVLSLICSVLQEWVAGLLALRASTLESGIRNLLNDSKTAAGLYSHPLIKGLAKGNCKPSYIPARTFALALMDVIAPTSAAGPKSLTDIRGAVGTLPDSLKKPLLILMDDAVGDLKKTRENLEGWFNDTMDRVSGWYKRRAQLILFFLALGVAGASNGDTFMIVNNLWIDAATRASIVKAAEEAVRQTPVAGQAALEPSSQVSQPAPANEGPAKTSAPSSTTSSSTTNQALGGIEKIQRLIGWSRADLPQSGLGWLKKAAGLLLTAIALSLGAPFWFDTLNNLIRLRAAGERPKKNTEGVK